MRKLRQRLCKSHARDPRKWKGWDKNSRKLICSWKHWKKWLQYWLFSCPIVTLGQPQDLFFPADGHICWIFLSCPAMLKALFLFLSGAGVVCIAFGGAMCVCGFFALGGWKVWQSSEDGVAGPSVWYGSSPLYPPSFEEESAPLYFSIMLWPFSFTCLGQVKGWRRENTWGIVLGCYTAPIALVWEEVLPLNFWRQPEKAVHYVTDSQSRLGKINGGKTKTNFSMTYVKFCFVP